MVVILYVHTCCIRSPTCVVWTQQSRGSSLAPCWPLPADRSPASETSPGAEATLPETAMCE